MRREGNVGTGIVVAGVGLLLFLPVLYVLSLGPAARLCEQQVLSESVAETIYAPLIAVADVCPPAESVLSAYVELWYTPTLTPDYSYTVPSSPQPAPQATTAQGS